MACMYCNTMYCSHMCLPYGIRAGDNCVDCCCCQLKSQKYPRAPRKRPDPTNVSTFRPENVHQFRHNKWSAQPSGRPPLRTNEPQWFYENSTANYSCQIIFFLLAKSILKEHLKLFNIFSHIGWVVHNGIPTGCLFEQRSTSQQQHTQHDTHIRRSHTMGEQPNLTG